MSFLGGIASGLIGGLFGLGGQSRARRHEKEILQNQLQWRAADAKAAGLHPLAGLGAAPYQATATGGGNPMGDALGRAAEHLFNRKGKKAEQALAKKQGDLIDAQIAESRSRTLLNAANARRPISGPQPGLTGIGGSDPRRVHSSSTSSPADAARDTVIEPNRDVPLTKRVDGSNENYVSPNEWPDVDELIGGAIVYGPQWVKNRARDALEGADRYAKNVRRGLTPKHKMQNLPGEAAPGGKRFPTHRKVGDRWNGYVLTRFGWRKMRTKK